MDYVLNVELVKKQLSDKSFKKVSDAFNDAKEFKCYIKVQASNDREYQLTDKTKEAFLEDIDCSLLVFQAVYHKQYELIKNMCEYWHVKGLLDWKEVLHIAFGLVDEEGVKLAWEYVASSYYTMTGYLQERIAELLLEAECPKQVCMLGEIVRRSSSFDRAKIRARVFQKSERHFLWMHDVKARKAFEEIVQPCKVPILESYLNYYHIDQTQVILELMLDRVPKEVIQYGIMPYL